MAARGKRLTEAEFAELIDELLQRAQMLPPKRLPQHLTEAELAQRWRVDVQVVAAKRKAGDGPPYLRLANSATKQTIRYPVAAIEAWEQEHLVVPGAA